MYIEWLEYDNKTTGQRINHINFRRMNLLVGKSAAGKTKILKVISNIFRIAVDGVSLSEQVHIKLGFRVHSIRRRKDSSSKEPDERSYVWELCTSAEQIDIEKEKPANVIKKETLYEGERSIFIRQRDRLTVMEGYKDIPRISLDKSVIWQFGRNEPLMMIQRNMESAVSLYEQKVALNPILGNFLVELEKRLGNRIANSQWSLNSLHGPIGVVIYVMHKYDTPKYDAFLDDLQTIFPEIENIDMCPSESNEKFWQLCIVADGKTIMQEDISDGMLKTIYILSVMHFCEPDSVLLYDELENSLGPNCLDKVVDCILAHEIEAHTQFILTSHHPYIISNFPTENWIIISQQNGVISSQRAADIGIGKTKRDSFFEYMQYIKDGDDR